MLLCPERSGTLLAFKTTFFHFLRLAVVYFLRVSDKATFGISSVKLVAGYQCFVPNVWLEFCVAVVNFIIIVSRLLFFGWRDRPLALARKLIRFVLHTVGIDGGCLIEGWLKRRRRWGIVAGTLLLRTLGRLSWMS